MVGFRKRVGFVTKRAIEESFPIVAINRLAIPERNAFKPIYQMHKWFARRASCVFRAILLGATKPAGTDIMEEFYKDHTDDPDTKDIKILDPFMGGGTTIIEALRLGCNVTGIDLNPVAWFIVKSEAESVDIEELKNSFERLAQRPTASGKSVRDELTSHYKTQCPCCGNEDADIIYTFWVKSAICTNPTCKKEVPLFNDFIISQKSPSIKYIPDYECPSCRKTFDLEIQPASLIAESSLSKENAKDSAGLGRGNKRWAWANNVTNEVACPWCNEKIKAGKDVKDKKIKKDKKRIPLTVLLCPHCYAVWQIRGTLSDETQCPICQQSYKPLIGNVVENGKFVCSSCGTKDTVIASIRKLPDDQPLPTKPYAIEGYCPICAGDKDESDDQFFKSPQKIGPSAVHNCMVSKNNGKFLKKITPADLKRYQDCEAKWQTQKNGLPYPKSDIPDGQETHRLLEHHYRYWYQMFNPRQLFCLSTLLKAIEQEDNQPLKEMLLSAFFNLLNNVSDFCSYRPTIGALRQVFARHDFCPKSTPTENNVWGTSLGMGTYMALFDAVLKGKLFNKEPFDRKFDENNDTVFEKRNESIIIDKDSYLLCGNSQQLVSGNYDAVITDPPYAGNVNYSELADYFYVWLRLSLANTTQYFAPEVTPKIDEIIENPTRGKSAEDYKQGLTAVWSKCHESLKEDGVLAFTFHHAEGSAWESLLDSICQAGFVLEAVYPIQGESESSLHLQENEAISYDLIHVCRKRTEDNVKKRSWAGIRQEIRKKARQEIQLIQSGRYGEGKISEADTNIVLIGKCLELYSKYYGNIVDHKDEPVLLMTALGSIRMMVEQLINTINPLPSELEHIDIVSYVYLTCLCDRKEIRSDEVHKATRGMVETEELFKAGVLRKGRAQRGRTYEVRLPDERLKELEKTFGKKDLSSGQMFLFPESEEDRFDDVKLVDIVHYLMGLAITGENLAPWLQEFKPVIVQVRVALDYMLKKNPTFQEPIQKILNLIEV